MSKNLVIVESPAKAKTIEKFLGKDFKVKSSYGHIRDLDKTDAAVDVDNDFKPKYIVPDDKQKVVKELKTWVDKVDEVWLATDEDREGEAISWHLCKVLGLDEKDTKRIVFREITKPAIQNAVENPRTVDINLVDAQQARRILDRIVGYKLSGTLWKKIKGKLSAGRVQSVALKLIVERERDIQQFKVTNFFKVSAVFEVENNQGKKVELKAEIADRFEDNNSAKDFVEKCVGAIYKIANIEVKPAKKSPSAPFITSTLQQDASRKLGFTPKRTMGVAQKLYENGHITYMRTDSTNLSELAVNTIAEEITNSFGESYLKIRKFNKKKSSNAQEAHEAIRPTYIANKGMGNTSDEQRLYELIWKRTIASQMADAKLERTLVDIAILDPSSNARIHEQMLKAEGEVLIFDGFLKVYLESSDEDDSQEQKGMLPPLKVGQELDLDVLLAKERFTRPPARYTEASLVKKLEELGIGRPSTYAPTISRIMEETRGYVVKENRDGHDRNFKTITLKDNLVSEKEETEITGAIKNRLIATDIGIVVTDFLQKNFEEIMNYSFTADIERQFDTVATGTLSWTKMLNGFYGPFIEKVDDTIENAERASGERILGKDPVSGRTLLVRLSRFGKPLVQIGKMDELEEDEKPKYANLNINQSLETINMEEALELFKLPKDLGEYKGKEVVVASGRFGPYIKYNEKFISLPRGEDPLGVKMDRAIELIDEKEKADAPIGTYKGQPFTRGKGRFGPFLKWGDLFVNIPKRFVPEELTMDECYELIAAKIEKEANRYIHRWDDLKLSVENGRWGPYIKWNKKNIKIPKINDEKVTSEMAKELTLEQVQGFVEAEYPTAFKKPKKKTKAKA